MWCSLHFQKTTISERICRYPQFMERKIQFECAICNRRNIFHRFMKEGNVRYVINDLQPKADQSIISQRFMKVTNHSTVLSAIKVLQEEIGWITTFHLFICSWSSDRPNVWFGRTVRPNFYCSVWPKWQNLFLQNTELFSLLCIKLHFSKWLP